MNIRDIARIANVTPGTVSKVLNNYPDISDATKQHVLHIIEEYQYSPLQNAKAKAAGAPSQIGLVVEGVYNSLYSSLQEKLSRRLHNADYTIMFFNDNYYVQDKHEKFQELLSYIDRHNLCGLIYIGGNFEPIEQKLFDTLSCPTIFVNTVLPAQIEQTTYSSIQVNHFETAYAQMNYLISKGHTHIATMISSTADNSVYGLRARGYRAALCEHGLNENLSFFLETDYIFPKAYDALKKHLAVHPETTAVCCVADIIAPAAIRAIHDAGKIPGKDIEIIGCDGIEIMSYCVPSITTFAQPMSELINYVYDLLLGLISGDRQHQHITFQTQLIKNESC